MTSKYPFTIKNIFLKRKIIAMRISLTCKYSILNTQVYFGKAMNKGSKKKITRCLRFRVKQLLRCWIYCAIAEMYSCWAKYLVVTSTHITIQMYRLLHNILAYNFSIYGSVYNTFKCIIAPTMMMLCDFSLIGG